MDILKIKHFGLLPDAKIPNLVIGQDWTSFVYTNEEDDLKYHCTLLSDYKYLITSLREWGKDANKPVAAFDNLQEALGFCLSKDICCKCKTKYADWLYMPGIAAYCDDCVPRGCSCTMAWTEDGRELDEYQLDEDG